MTELSGYAQVVSFASLECRQLVGHHSLKPEPYEVTILFLMLKSLSVISPFEVQLVPFELGVLLGAWMVQRNKQHIGRFAGIANSCRKQNQPYVSSFSPHESILSVHFSRFLDERKSQRNLMTRLLF
jgi:hypothetical protein